MFTIAMMIILIMISVDHIMKPIDSGLDIDGNQIHQSQPSELALLSNNEQYSVLKTEKYDAKLCKYISGTFSQAEKNYSTHEKETLACLRTLKKWKIDLLETRENIRGKPLGKLIWKSIQNGPSPHPMVTDPPATDQAAMNMPRLKLDLEFTPEETNSENADTQAEIILGQGLPRHIFNILNQTNTAKEIWDNVAMLMQVVLRQRKVKMFSKQHPRRRS
ncbi:reverse transcriptase [Tanacetum coccineum]